MSNEQGEAGIPIVPPVAPSGPIPPYAVAGDLRHEAFRTVFAEADRRAVPVPMGGGVVSVQHGLIAPWVSTAARLLIGAGESTYSPVLGRWRRSSGASRDARGLPLVVVAQSSAQLGEVS